MMAVPLDTPVTLPVVAFTDATTALLVVHVPPLTVLVYAVLLPEHIADAPLNTPALAPLTTVTLAVAIAVPHVLATL